MYLLAIDLGSTSIKAIIFDYQGNEISSGRRKTEVSFKEENNEKYAFWMPDDLWNRVSGAIKDAVSAIDDPGKIKGISVTGFACDGVPIDEKGEWIYPFISWHDSRTIEQFEWLEKNHRFEDIYLINGQKPWNLNTIFRNLWVKQHLPEIYKKIYKWLLIEDYINFKLCGIIATDYSLASTTLMFDQKNLEWSKTLFNLFDIRMDIYPDPKPTGTYLGEVDQKAAKVTGLKQGTPVVLGGLDGLLGVYAAAGDQSDSLVGVVGTYEHYHKCLEKPILRKEGLESTIICQAHVIKDKYDIYGVAVSSGVLEWFKDNLAAQEDREAKESGRNIWEILMEKAGNVSMGSGGIFMLTDIFGSTCPIQDNYSRGAFIGLTLSHTRSDMARAVMEGIVYELRRTMEDISEVSPAIWKMVGGAAASKVWPQIVADTTHLPVAIPSTTEAASCGAAILAGVGSGVFPDSETGYQNLIGAVTALEPNAANGKRYDELFQIYCAASDQMADSLVRLSDFGG